MVEQYYHRPARASVVQEFFLSMHSTQVVAVDYQRYLYEIEDEGEEFWALPKCCRVPGGPLGLFIPLEPRAEAIRTEGHYSCAVKQIINIQTLVRKESNIAHQC